MAGLVRWWAGRLYTLLFGHEDRFILSVCFLVSLQNPHLINLNLSMVNYLIVFMVGHWVCLDVCWLEGMFWPCLVWRRMRRLLAVAVGAQSSDSQVPLRVLLVKAQLWQVLLEHGSDKITPQHAAAGGPTQASKIVSELGERFNFRLWELLLLLLSCFSHVRLCATPETAAHQAPPSLGFSRQEHWSGLPFPSPMHESEKGKWSRSVMSVPRDLMDCSPPGSSVHGIFQARVLEWGAIAFSTLRVRPFFFFVKSVVAYHPFLTHLPTLPTAANKTFIVLCHDVA